ncbi:anthrone oxygenase family protein [Nonomuraea sp. bgisy101]|uniref:anthrone oxygenase family protein n=1 Tax=Nonomuraea sp. bgisy101 TaxID=3413784 RepID=UPI003D751CCD
MRTPVRSVQGAALLTTGLLAGAFGYGAANVVPTFAAVPLDVRLTFHTTMMKVNEPVMRSAMALAILTSFGLAVVTRGLSRRLAIGAGALALTSLLVTVFGNVPLHAHIRQWAATSVTPGYVEILQRWELFHTLRTLTAVAAFVLIVSVAVFVQPTIRSLR